MYGTDGTDGTDPSRTFAAVLCNGESLVSDGTGQRHMRTLVERLCAFCVEIVVVTGMDIARFDKQLGARPVGPGRLYVWVSSKPGLYEVGPAGAHEIDCEVADAATWAAGHFESLGIGPGLVLIAADAQLIPRDYARATVVSAREPDRLADLLIAQVRRHEKRRVPDVDEDPAWSIVLEHRARESMRADESLLSLADGSFGTRGSVEEDGPGTMSGVRAAGVYTAAGPSQHLLDCPGWTGVRVAPLRRERRLLDLRTGVLVRSGDHDDGDFRSLRFVSTARPGTAALRVESSERLRGAPLQPPAASAVETVAEGRVAFMRVCGDPHGGVSAAASQRRTRDGESNALERIAAFTADPTHAPAIHAPRQALDDANAAGFEALLREQRAHWAACWEDADVEIPDAPQLQRALRFAIFHLVSCAADRGEAAVGARGLSGPGYSGHVFWDADVFVLPVLAAVAPPRARAMLEYRLRRLAAARTAARALGRRGARFPWESACDGTDVTPRTAMFNGKVTPILTGQQQEHVVADVAWAAWHYARWTGDDEFLTGVGYPLLTDTARYWASRIRLGVDGRSHIDHVIGPDEYHVDVDDDVFTNVMARWNLRAGAELVDRCGPASEREEATCWRAHADSLVDGFDSATGVYEQFAGYSQLEPLLIAKVARPPVAADLLLGADRIAHSQVIKQADVLMVHHLLPEETEAESLLPNLEFYGPRTAHGSSLSPAIHASLHARAGQFDEALRWLGLAARLDLDDVTAMTSAGLHLATLGGLWQAVAFGFVGLRWDGTAVRIDPRLPDEWRTLTLRCRIRGARLVVRVGGDVVTVTSDRPLPIAAAGQEPTVTTHAVLPVG